MLSKKKLLSRFDEFVTGISKEDNFLIMAHGDADGLCSATIASKALFKIVGKKPKHYRFMYYGEKNLSKKIPKILKEDKLNKVIVMDWSVDQTPDLVKSIEKHAEKILILDHHKVYKDMNSKKTLMIKAQWISSKDGSKYPATKMCYDLFSRHASLEELQWVCAVGIIADSSEKAWKNFMDKAFKKYSVKKKKLMRETVFGKIVEMIEALQAIGPYKFYSYVDLFFKADVPKKVL
ncbi:MAG: DHH family phosphoesterase, partial [Candidatus Diapherotrites archaeon]|nr:DHH family phosphoesterase [Candidatus Diapherotrites archaeon]